MSDIKIVILDIDGTLLKEQSQLLLIQYLRKNNIIPFFYYIRILFWFILYKLGIAKDPKVVFEFAIKFLQGREVEEVIGIMRDFIGNVLCARFESKIVSLVKGHIERGDRVIIVSNIIQPLTQVIAEYMGISEHIGTDLEINSGVYTGKIINNITYGKEKLKKLLQYLTLPVGSTLPNSVAYADHYSDIYLLKTVTTPIVVNPKKKLLSYAHKNRWKIIHTL